MTFDISWAAVGVAVALLFFAVMFMIEQQRELGRIKARLKELIENYNQLLIVLRLHQPEIFGEIKPGEVGSRIPSE